MASNVPTDRSNGYEAVAGEFISRRTRSRVGPSTVRAWARGLREGSSVLELGCGHGRPITQVLVDEGFVVYGIDASPTLLAKLRAQFPGIPAECNAVEDSAFFERTFDGVVAWGLMFLLTPETQQVLIHKIATALRPGGRLLFTSPRQACEWTDNLTGRLSVSLGADRYREILEEAGLTVVDEVDDEGENHYYFARRTGA